jgi:hypothetical protein
MSAPAVVLELLPAVIPSVCAKPWPSYGEVQFLDLGLLYRPLQECKMIHISEEVDSSLFNVVLFHWAKRIIGAMDTGTIEVSKILQVGKSPRKSISTKHKNTDTRLDLFGFG